MFGFTYNGVHSSKFGLYYTRTAEEKWISDAEYDVYDEDVSWRHGGYYYGSKAKNRTFTIKCMFEEIDIPTRQQIKQWLRRDSSGTLIFDDMPFVYWNVHPGKIPVGNWYLDTNESYSGTVTITFNTYEPFGYLTRKSNSASSPDDHAEDYCNIISSDDMPDAPSTSSRDFYIYNPGTEECGMTIEVAGSTSNPVRFYNDRNGTICELESLPTNDVHLRVDGDTGYVEIRSGAAGANGYAYHEKGVVRLGPSSGYSGIDFTYNGVNGTTYSFTLTGMKVTRDLIGAVMNVTGLSNTIFRVVDVSASSNRIYCSRTGSGTPSASGTLGLRLMNHIIVEEKINGSWGTPSTLSLTFIDVDFNPRLL